MAIARTSTVKFKKIFRDIERGYRSARFKKDLGKTTVKAAKALIAVGKSPVAGYGRFGAYSGQRAQKGIKGKGAKAKKRSAAKRGYPGSVVKEFPQKRARPINLKLSGKLLKAYNWESSGKFSVRVGILSKASNLIKIISGAHNEGVATKNIIQRRHVPQGSEEFAISIQREIKKVYVKHLRGILRRRNKK